MTPIIRIETTADHDAILHVNRIAFGQDDEAGIVAALRNGGYTRLSLVAEVSGKIVGHILFSSLPILTDNGTVPALSLAPMAVLPEFQKQGIGSALVQKGLEPRRSPHFSPPTRSAGRRHYSRGTCSWPSGPMAVFAASW